MKVVNKTRKTISALLASALLAAGAVSVAQADDHGEGATAEVGIVTCNYIEGSKVNLLIHSSAGFDCSFKHSGGVEYYAGEAGIGLGLDLQWTTKSRMRYSVMATTSKSLDWSTALNGTYTGGKAAASFGVGVGAAVLVGGSNDTIGLVPLALEGMEGAGASAGIGYLTLKNK